jgi:hypothetical protein
MSKDSSKRRIQKSKCFIVFWMMSLFLLAFSQTIIRSTRTNRPVINFTADIQFTYDDNIFLYSEKDLRDFERSIQPSRFPFETSDDFITTLTGNLRLRPRVLPQAVFRYRVHHYTVNPIKSYQVFSLNLEQRISKPISFEAGYLFLPKYLIRYYKDPITKTSPPTYIGCSFTEHLYSARVNYNLTKPVDSRLGAVYKFEIDDYARNFNYYDTRAHRFELSAGCSFNRQAIALNGNVKYKIASAQGPVPDISYDQWAWMLTARLVVAYANQAWHGVVLSWQRIILRLNYGQEKRDFITNNPSTIDPFHAGRVDKTQIFGVGMDFLFTRYVSVNLGYNFEKRDVSSPFREEIDDIKDYTNNKIRLEFSFRRF